MVMSPLIAAACSPYPRGLDSLVSIEPDRKPAGRLFVSVQQLPAREAATETSMTSIVSFAETQAAEEEATPSSPQDEASLLADDGDELADEGEEGEEGEEEPDGEEDMVNALLALSQGRQAPTPAPREAAFVIDCCWPAQAERRCGPCLAVHL